MTHAQSTTSATRILAGLLETRSGQQIAPSRFWRIQTALSPVLKTYGIPDLEALIAVLGEADTEKLQQLVLEAMLNNESFFFRDTAMFAALRNRSLRFLHLRRAKTKTLRIWSAGCSTGQEAYSLAMLIHDDQALWKGWNVEIVASDISHSVLQQARTGRYSQFEIQRGLSVNHMLRYFRQDGRDWVIDPEIQAMVSFKQDNLLRPRADIGRFDLILCRNVLMYFAEESRHAAYSRISKAVAPDGLLMLGAAETASGHTGLFAPVPDLRGMYGLSGSVDHLRVADILGPEVARP